MAAQQLILSWKDHNSSLVSVFENLLKKNTLVDCTLAAEGQYMKAHKVVLSACSSYFELLFSQESDKNPIVILKDVKFQELEAAVHFMYRGEVAVCEDRLAIFLEVAESLQIKGLGGDGKSQDSKENVSTIKCLSAKSAVTQRPLSRKEVSNRRIESTGQSSNVPIDYDQIRNNESSSVHQSFQRGSSPALTVSTFSVGSSSCPVKKETNIDLDSLENIQQSLSLPCLTPGENVQSEENPIIKTEPETDTFLENLSDEVEGDFVDDITKVDDQIDWDEPNTETIDEVLTNKEDIFENIKTRDSTSENVEGMQSGDQYSCDSEGMDSLVIEDIEQPSPSSVQFYPPVAATRRSNASGKSTDSTLQRTTPQPPSKKLFCVNCNMMFKRLMDLKRHVRSQSCGALPSVSGGEQSPSDTSSAQPLKLRKTDRRSSTRGSFKCSDCNYVTSWLFNFKRHLRTHAGEKPYKCSYCHLTYGNKRSLVAHVRTHTGERAFKCQHCDYAFTRRNDLVRHLMIHTGEKPFKCHHCDYAFIQKTNLAEHLMIHTGEKPFKCQHCDYATTRRRYLAQHLMKHTGEKPFKCQHCDYASTRKGDLGLHLMIHLGETPLNVNI